MEEGRRDVRGGRNEKGGGMRSKRWIMLVLWERRMRRER